MTDEGGIDSYAAFVQEFRRGLESNPAAVVGGWHRHLLLHMQRISAIGVAKSIARRSIYQILRAILHHFT